MMQSHDLTALCESCHELTSMVRDWVLDKGASMDDLMQDLRFCNTYIAKREVFSYWLYPEDDEESVISADIPDPILGTEERGTFNDQIHGLQAQIGHDKYARAAIKHQVERIKKGESLDTPDAWEDAAVIDSDLTWEGLNDEDKNLGREIGAAIGKRENLRKHQTKVDRWRFFFALCGVGILLYLVFSLR